MTTSSGDPGNERIRSLCKAVEATQLLEPTDDRAELLRHLWALLDCAACAGEETAHSHTVGASELRSHLRRLDAGSLGAAEAQSMRELASDDDVARILARSQSSSRRGVAWSRQAAGDQDFDVFVREHYDPLLRYAVMLAGRRADAEEILQEALLRCLTRWRKVPADNAVAYARKAVHHEFLRAVRRRPPVTQDAAAEQPGAMDFTGAVDDRHHVLHLLQQLPARQRAAVVHRVVLDMTEAQTAAELGWGVGTVKSLTSRGLAKVRELWRVEAAGHPAR